MKCRSHIYAGEIIETILAPIRVSDKDVSPTVIWMLALNEYHLCFFIFFFEEEFQRTQRPVGYWNKLWSNTSQSVVTGPPSSEVAGMLVKNIGFCKSHLITMFPWIWFLIFFSSDICTKPGLGWDHLKTLGQSDLSKLWIITFIWEKVGILQMDFS